MSIAIFDLNLIRNGRSKILKRIESIRRLVMVHTFAFKMSQKCLISEDFFIRNALTSNTFYLFVYCYFYLFFYLIINFVFTIMEKNYFLFSSLISFVLSYNGLD